MPESCKLILSIFIDLFQLVIQSILHHMNVRSYLWCLFLYLKQYFLTLLYLLWTMSYFMNETLCLFRIGLCCFSYHKWYSRVAVIIKYVFSDLSGWIPWISSPGCYSSLGLAWRPRPAIFGKWYYFLASNWMACSYSAFCKFGEFDWWELLWLNCCIRLNLSWLIFYFKYPALLWGWNIWTIWGSKHLREWAHWSYMFMRVFIRIILLI